MAAVAGLIATEAMARANAVPSQTSSPTFQGPATQPFVGDKLTTSNGTWSGSPTRFTYQWDRCDAVGDRQNCVAITGATSQSYTAVTADVNHRLHANVSATNADGTGKADTKASGVVAPAASPANRVRPAITGSESVGSTLTAGTGTWTGATTFSFQWRQCDQNGNNCADIAGASGATYGVRSADVGHELQVRVKATNRFGATTAESDRTAAVVSDTQTTTNVVTTTLPANKAPAITFLSLKRIGTRIYARVRVCDDSSARVRIVERDNKARALSYTRRFAVSGCGTFAHNWLLLARFRGHGRLSVTFRATDAEGNLSRLVARSVATA